MNTTQLDKIVFIGYYSMVVIQGLSLTWISKLKIPIEVSIWREDKSETQLELLKPNTSQATTSGENHLVSKHELNSTCKTAREHAKFKIQI